MASVFVYYSIPTMFVFYFGISILFTNNGVAGIKPIEYPSDTTVFVGDPVHFTCTILEPQMDNQIFDWLIFWDGSSLHRASAQVNNTVNEATDIKYSGHGVYTTKYFMSTEDDGSKIHKCDLSISQTTLQDNGYFGCTHQINPAVSHRTLIREKIRLNVLPLEAQDPQCSFTESDAFGTLTCIAEGGNPPALVTWLEGEVPYLDSRFNSQTIQVQKQQLYQTFTCNAQQDTLPPKTCTIVLSPLSAIPATTATTKKSTTKFATTTMTTYRQDTSTELVSKVRRITPSQSVVATTTKTGTPPPLTFEAADMNCDASGTTTAVIVGGVLGSVILVLVFLLLLQWFRKAHTNTQETLGVSEPNINAPQFYESAIAPSGNKEVYTELNVTKISAPSHIYQDLHPARVH